MNAISYPAAETQAERTERHLQMLRRLGELCMSLAETAAAQARAEQAQEAASRAAAGDPGEDKTRPSGSAALVLARLANATRQIIAMECRVAAGTKERAPAYASGTQAGNQRVADRVLAAVAAAPSHAAFDAFIDGAEQESEADRAWATELNRAMRYVKPDRIKPRARRPP